jgi:hypothetical protein
MDIALTQFTKTGGGPLTKVIRLLPDGTLKSDGSACLMSTGCARRVRLDGLGQVGALIQSLNRNEAIALGTIRAGLPDNVKVVTQGHLAQLNGTASFDTIAHRFLHQLRRRSVRAGPDRHRYQGHA